MAASAQNYDEAILKYTTASSLDLPSPQGVLIKRSKAYLATGSWKKALDDSNQVHRYLLQVNCAHLSSDYHAGSFVAMGLRDEARSLAQGRRL